MIAWGLGVCWDSEVGVKMRHAPTAARLRAREQQQKGTRSECRRHKESGRHKGSGPVMDGLARIHQFQVVVSTPDTAREAGGKRSSARGGLETMRIPGAETLIPMIVTGIKGLDKGGEYPSRLETMRAI